MLPGIKTIVNYLGYDIRRLTPRKNVPNNRPVGDIRLFLEDLRFRGFHPNVLLDIGGNVGSWSRMCKGVFPDIACYLLEPQPEMKPPLDRFCAEYPGSRWLQAAAGAVPGELPLTIWDDLQGSSFMPSLSGRNLSRPTKKVPVVTVDSLIGQRFLPIPDLVKLDVQGFELEALKGAAQLFGKTEVFILETSLFRFMGGEPIFHEVAQFMAERAYVVYDFPGFSRRPRDGALGQCDVCFVRENSPLRNCSDWS